MNNPTAEQVTELVEKSTKAQGVPFKVTDPVVIAAVAVLFGDASDRLGSEAPDQVEAVRVEGVAAFDAGGDSDVVEDGLDDRLAS